MFKKLMSEIDFSTQTSLARQSLLKPSTEMREIGANFCLGVLSTKMKEKSSSGITLNHVAFLVTVLGAVTLLIGSLGAADLLFLSLGIVLTVLVPLMILTYFAGEIFLSALPGSFKKANRIGYAIGILGVGVIFFFPETSYALTCTGVIVIGLLAIAVGAQTLRPTEFNARASTIFAAERRLDRFEVREVLSSASLGMQTIAGMLSRCRNGVDQIQVVEEALDQFRLWAKQRDVLGFSGSEMRGRLERLIELDRQQAVGCVISRTTPTRQNGA
jgi:hypothetical protein